MGLLHGTVSFPSNGGAAICFHWFLCSINFTSFCGGEARRFCEGPDWWRHHLLTWRQTELFTQDATLSTYSRENQGKWKHKITVLGQRSIFWQLNRGMLRRIWTKKKCTGENTKRKNWGANYNVFTTKQRLTTGNSSYISWKYIFKKIRGVKCDIM